MTCADVFLRYSKADGLPSFSRRTDYVKDDCTYDKKALEAMKGPRMKQIRIAFPMFGAVALCAVRRYLSLSPTCDIDPCVTLLVTDACSVQVPLSAAGLQQQQGLGLFTGRVGRCAADVMISLHRLFPMFLSYLTYLMHSSELRA